MSMKAKILELLREKKEQVAAGAPESGVYVSGQELCEQFGVSRTAVWKAIGQLKKEGYVIEAVQNRGYRLVEQAQEVYNQADIQSRLKTKWVGHPLLFFDSIDSTNIRAKQEAEQGAENGLLVVADQQTAGRGRRGRGWESPAATNIYYTLMLKPDFNADCAPMLTLVMALAVAKASGRHLAVTAGRQLRRSVSNGPMISSWMEKGLRHPHRDEHGAGLYPSHRHRCGHQCAQAGILGGDQGAGSSH